MQPESKLINRALHLLQEKFLEYKYVEDFADELNIAKETLSGKFKQECGVGLKRLLLALKMNHAVYLLTHSNLSINEISAQVNFKIPQRFDECFRKVFVMSPGEFRRNEKNQQNADEKLLKFIGRLKKT